MAAPIITAERSVIDTGSCSDTDINIEALAMYNLISEGGLRYLDSLQAQDLRDGRRILAYFPYDGSGDVESEKNLQIEHARESFLLGLAIRAKKIDRLPAYVSGHGNFSPHNSKRKLAKFAGKIIYEEATFDEDATLPDRTLLGRGGITGLAYFAVQAAKRG